MNFFTWKINVTTLSDLFSVKLTFLQISLMQNDTKLNGIIILSTHLAVSKDMKRL